MRLGRRLRVVIVLRRARGGLARFVTGSLTVHGLLLVLILVVPSGRQKVAPIDDPMVVALAGPIAAAAPRAGASPAPAAKPAVEPHPVPKGAHTVREVPAVKPKDKPVKPQPAPSKPEAPASRPETSAAPAKGADENAKPGEAAAQGGVTATLGGGDSSLGWYGAAVKAALESVWIKPYLEDAQGIASVVVAFDIARDGTTRNLRIVQSSGIPSLDRSAERAVIEASPLPAVPPSWTAATIPVTMRFELNPETR